MADIITDFHGIEESLKGVGGYKEFYFSKTNPRIESLIDIAEKKGVAAIRISDKKMSEYSGKIGHKGFLLRLERSGKIGKKFSSLNEYLNALTGKNALVLVLDSITDTRNYGAILRSADQFAVDVVVIPSRRSVKNTEIISKTSAGSNVYVNTITVQNISRCLRQLRENDFWIYGASVSGKRADRTVLKGRVALVMGSEGRGIGRLVMEMCDDLISIPSKGNIDSFNVSVASGILMYEIKRQQGFE